MEKYKKYELYETKIKGTKVKLVYGC